MSCGESDARVGGAGLDDHRPALGRSGHVEGTFDVEELTVVRGRVDLGRIGELTRLLVPDQGTVLPSVPEPVGQVDELGGAPVTVLPREHLLAEVGGGTRRGGCHHVPAAAPVAGVVEAEDTPGQVVRPVEGRRQGGDETDALGGHGQRGAEQRGLETLGGAGGDPRVLLRDVRQEQGVE